MKGKTTLLTVLGLLVFAGATAPSRADEPQPQGYPIAPGKFQPTDESLKQYQYPEWFRDAKLGIWAHWGPQSVPMDGDWYARNEYIQGQRQYKDHLQHYGHPSKTGYKDIIPLWRAEKWDPDRLMEMYKKAGAKYFVSMGVHHDNFDLWDSKYHRWNAVKMGPHRDVVGTWEAAARKLGLRFGVSEHLGASFTWFQPSHGSDKTGPLAGVPYDGANKEYWDLYHWPAAPDDKGWYSKDPKWQQEWFNRIKDLVDHYHPDLLYSDGPVPFNNEVGRSMIAHFYNQSAARNNGTVDVVYNCKQVSNGEWVEDLERGVMPGIRPHPWQTDTSIGDWFYNRNWKYRGADWVIPMLVDIVSKNGNLLINVVQRPDGSLDPEAEQVVRDMADWIAVNGEGIYSTRPWLVYGEGKHRAKGGSFGEGSAKYTADDIRFTSKGDNTLYVFALGWPEDHKLSIRSLAQYPGVTAKIENIQLLGHDGAIKWKESPEALTVDLPDRQPSKWAICLKITGQNLRGFKPEMAVTPVQSISPDSRGNYTLRADDAELHGNQIKAESRGNQSNLGFWDNPKDWASWKVKFDQPGTYKVSVSYAAASSSALIIDAAGQKVEKSAPATGGWDQFKRLDMGTVQVTRAGEQQVLVRPQSLENWKPVNLRWVRLSRESR